MKKQLSLTGWYLRRSWFVLFLAACLLYSTLSGWNIRYLPGDDGVYRYVPSASSGYDFLYALLRAREEFLIIGGFCALVLHWDSMRPRQAELLGSLPIRREERFFARLLAGILLLAIPALVSCFAALPTTKETVFTGTAFLLMWATSLEGLAGGFLACTLCGTRRGAALVWTVGTFFPVLLANLFTLEKPFYPLLAIAHWLSPMDATSFAANNLRYVLNSAAALKNIPVLLQALGTRMLWCIPILLLALVLARKQPAEKAGSFSYFPGLKGLVFWILFLYYCRTFANGLDYSDAFYLYIPQYVLLGPPMMRIALDFLMEPRVGFKSRVPRMLLETAGGMALAQILFYLYE